MRRISLKFTLDDEVGYLSQPFRQSHEALPGVICLTPPLLGQLTCPANPQDAYVGRLVIIGVLPSGFTQRGCSGFRVEHVINDLKRKTNAFCEMVEIFQPLFVKTFATVSTEHDGCTDKSASLVDMHE